MSIEEMVRRDAEKLTPENLEDYRRVWAKVLGRMPKNSEIWPSLTDPELIEAMKKRGYKIIFITGRKDDHLEASKQWLAKNKVNYDLIYARESEDRRGDEVVKKDFFENQIKDKYTGLNIISYEVYFNEENRQLFGEMTRVYNTEIQGVPTLFINDKVLVGFSNSIAVSIEQEIEKCTTQTCISPLEKLKSGSEVSDSTLKIIEKNNQNKDAEKTELTKKLTIPAVISAAAVDAINPCEFAILIILLTTILASGGKRKALYAGLAFALSIYISYFLMGLGLYSVIQISGLTRIFYTIVAILAIIIGLFNLKDYLWYGKWFTMEVPMRWRPKMKSIVKKVTSVPGAFLVGFVVSLFLLPCTSGLYIVILGLLSETAIKNITINSQYSHILSITIDGCDSQIILNYLGKLTLVALHIFLNNYGRL